VFENRVLRRIFGPKGDEMIGGCRKLHNEELQNLISSPDMIRMIKSRRWVQHVARTGGIGLYIRILVERPKERICEYIDVGGRIILKLIFET
jgi:hypothetical protein